MSLFLVGCLVSFVLGAGPHTPSVELFNAAVPGTRMPIIGLGTGGYGNASGYGGEYWDNDVAQAAVTSFLAAGGRRLDTSLMYYTQIGVGKAWKASGIPREEIFITSKSDIPGYGMIPGGWNMTMQSIATTLEQLQTDYVDLMLIHWPGTANTPSTPPPCLQPGNNWTVCRQETWRALEQAFRDRKLRAIGVSNFEVKHFADIMALRSLMPSVNQFEYHPYWQSPDLMAFCEQHRITMNGYAPLATPDHMIFYPKDMPVLLPNNTVVTTLAQKYNKSPAQIIIKWELQNRFVVNPRSKSAAHQVENLDVFDFELAPADMDALKALQNGENVCGNPNLIP